MISTPIKEVGIGVESVIQLEFSPETGHGMCFINMEVTYRNAEGDQQVEVQLLRFELPGMSAMPDWDTSHIEEEE